MHSTLVLVQRCACVVTACIVLKLLIGLADMLCSVHCSV